MNNFTNDHNLGNADKIDSILEQLSEILLIKKKDNFSNNDNKIIHLKNIIGGIISLINYNNKEINIKVIKFLSILISNSEDNNLNFLYFLIDHKYLNKLILNLCWNAQELDEDYLSYYINYLKKYLINKH